MATTSDFTLVIRDASGVLVTTGNYDLRTPDFSSAGVSGVYANGVWTFSDLAGDEPYKLYNTDTDVYANWGGADGTYIFDGDVGAEDVEAGTFAGQMVFSTSPHVPTASGTGDALPYEQGGKLASNDTVTGNWTFSNGASAGTVTIGGTHFLNVSSTVRPQIGSASTTGSGSAGAILRQDEVDAKISNALNNLPEAVVMSPKNRFVIPGLTSVTNKVYGSIAQTVANIQAVGGSLSALNRYRIFIWDDGTGSHIELLHASIVSFIDIVAMSPDVNIIVGGTGESTTVTATMNITGCNLWFGNSALSGARTYNNIYFRQCEIYHYNDLTIGGTGKLDNVNFYSGTGNNVTLDGTVELFDVDSTQAFAFGTYTGKFKRAVTDESHTDITMPVDPTIA